MYVYVGLGYMLFHTVQLFWHDPPYTIGAIVQDLTYRNVTSVSRTTAILVFLLFIWFVRLLALRPPLAYCASLG
jgi:hypothetical protein